MTELWLSWAKRSHSTSPEPFVAVPYRTPVVADSSAEANGNDAARASVSNERRCKRASTPTGRVDTQPCRLRQVAGWESRSIEEQSARTRAHSASSACSLGACTVR